MEGRHIEGVTGFDVDSYVSAPSSSRSRRRRSALYALLAILTGVLVPLFIVEGLLQILPVSTATGAMPVNEANPIIRYTPNQAFVFSRGWRFSLLNAGHINNYGFVNEQDYARGQAPGPLVVIGDSYVEAKMVPYQGTVQGRLARRFQDRIPVYSLGFSGSQLAQYLAFAQYAWNEFRPGMMAFVIVGNDFDESLLKYKREPGLHYFVEQPGSHEPGFVRMDYSPTAWKRVLRHSALVRYLWTTIGIGNLRTRMMDQLQAARYVGNTAAEASEERLNDSRRVVEWFLHELSVRVPLPPSRIVFVVDGMRPELYSDTELDRGNGSYFDVMRRYFLEKAAASGYETVDMQPRLKARHRRDGSRFEFELDSHWNEVGHEEAAQAIAASVTVETLLGERDQ